MMEDSPRNGTLSCCSRLVRALLSVDIRCCLFIVVLLSVVLFVILGIVMTSTRRGDPQRDLRTLDENVMAVLVDPSPSETTDLPALLLLMIHASANAEGRKRRDAIRNTWLSDVDKLSEKIGQAIMYKFVLGGKNLSRESQSNVTKENETYQDMIILDNVTDSHDTLTQRTLQSFQYIVKQNYNFQFFMKCDDDTFVNLQVIAKELKDKQDKKQFYWGEFLGATGILREGPYAEQKWSTCETYLPYAYGGGYVLSKDLVELVAANAPFLMIYNNEDVSLGAWLAPFNINYQFDARFNTGAVSRGCKKQFIVMHKISAETMYNYSRAVESDGYMCNRKNRWFGWHGHIYNWNALPSKCCRRKRRVP